MYFVRILRVCKHTTYVHIKIENEQDLMCHNARFFKSSR